MAKQIHVTPKQKVPPLPIVNAVNAIRGQFGKIQRKMVPPNVAAFEMITGMWNAQAIGVLATLGIPDVMKNEDLGYDEIARKVGAHADSVYRLLRALTFVDVVEELPEKKFRLTAIGHTLRSDVPGSARSLAIFQTQYNWSHWGELLHSVKTGEVSVPRVRGGKDLFAFMQEHKDAQAQFDDYMTLVSGMETSAVLAAYSFAGARVIADVGGGHGSLLSQIIEATPDARGILFDQPHVVKEAKLEGELKKRIETRGGSFFETVPAGADVYLMKHIIHDWEESKCVTILKHIREAIPTHGKLVLIETVVTPRGIPHFSKALDLEMLVAAGGRERTAEQYAELFAKCGFRLTRVVPTASVASVIEAVPV